MRYVPNVHIVDSMANSHAAKRSTVAHAQLCHGSRPAVDSMLVNAPPRLGMHIVQPCEYSDKRKGDHLIACQGMFIFKGFDTLQESSGC